MHLVGMEIDESARSVQRPWIGIPVSGDRYVPNIGARQVDDRRDRTSGGYFSRELSR